MSKASDLGLKDSALPYATLAQAIPGLTIICRSRCMNNEVASRGTILVDAGNEDLCTGDPPACYLAVPVPGDDWYVVNPDKSAIFVNENGGLLTEHWPWLTVMCLIGKVELAVICDCCGTCPDILEYVNDVISEAVNDCKGVRVSCIFYPLLYCLTHLCLA
jgi:hypothetical protein